MDLCRKVGTARYNEHEQRRRNCALPGFDTSTWTSDRLIRIHMGAPRDYSREGQGDWAAPVEPSDQAGCPGAWYRTPFTTSIERYRRRRDEHGGRIDNPALSQCTDPLVHEAVLLLEAFEDGALGEFREKRAQQLRREAGL